MVDAAPAFIINDILKGYNKPWNLGFDRTLAAKSGTTNVGTSTGDGWLMAYNPDVVIATWAGHTSNDPKEGNATKGMFGVYLAQPIVDPFLKNMPGRWQSDFIKPSNIASATCGQGGLSVPDPVDPELIIAGGTPSCTAPTPSPVPTEVPVVGPSQEPSPSPSQGGILISPRPTGPPSPSPGGAQLPGG